MEDVKKIIQAIAVTAELCGTKISNAASEVLLQDLSSYSDKQILDALHRVRKEIKGRMTIADILDRIEDGRPSAAEAWGIAQAAYSEDATLVWTEEMREAFRCVADNRSGAASIFMREYNDLCKKNRSFSKPVKWEISLGHDKSSRHAAIENAINKGYISISPGVAAALGFSFTETAKLPDKIKELIS